ncbi:lymphatic vessel endothelial hyaluronic acid receptor 1a [Hippoglossus stenolepis]|uniref:lymphatic vessel endothelial hyaluronic acid receptor 1a n=1 Tax=Hippoglossus stenolepis TaxID=195615 RepID=UPI00159C64FC|nr:lymphatic vessel endothelial hyaluronic acid receptor 1a [Hippoglossus stenolepis]
MNMIWLCLTSVLSFTSLISGQSVDTSNIRVFPAMNQSIAGVFQVSSLNLLNQPEYAFNASEARSLCLSLGVHIASKAQVNSALDRGLETCRFGWIDEHFAVVPRIKPLSTCGRGQTGLVPWRASVKTQFDVFCFNESDAVTQLKDATTTSPLSSSDHSEQTHSTQTTQSASSSSSPRSSSSSAPQTRDHEGEPARYIGSAIRSAGGKVVLITSTCGLLLTAIILIVYLKSRRVESQSSDMKQQQESIETEDWTCVKSVEQTEEDAQDEEKIQVEDEDKDVSLNLSDSDATE